MSIQNASSSYHPRNVINASEIKKEITKRCQARTDNADIQHWMMNHFYRYVIGNFTPSAPALIQIHSLEEALEKLNHKKIDNNTSNAIPDWLKKACLSDSTLYWLDIEHPVFFELEAKFIEFLYSKQNNYWIKKLNKINAVQALALYEHDHRLFEIKQLNGEIKHHPKAVTSVFKTSIGEFVELNPSSTHFREELMFESQHMRHCLGQFEDKKLKTGGYAEYYAKRCENQQMKIFSFRTENQLPKITISAHIDTDLQLTILEVKGKQNKPPVEKYHGLLLEFLNALPCKPCYPMDLCRIGLVFCENKWQKMGDIKTPELQAQITWQVPELGLIIKNRPPMVDWVLAARAPNLLNHLENNDYIKNHLHL